ncbi:MAG: AMP-binding protein, partial [Rickettsiales bacterium]|nr:AMP-binding protein [Rickettsiales bacterium]
MSNANKDDHQFIQASDDFTSTLSMNKECYDSLYQQSIDKPEEFWSEHAHILDWEKEFTHVKTTSFAPEVSIKWFEDGQLNACYNCVDRHLEKHADKTAIIWEGNDRSESKNITYKEMYHEVCKFANTLNSMGIKKGDTVVIYMPMIPEAAYAMLACARIGAVHSVVFGGFSSAALKGRIEDCDAKLIITANEGRRGAKTVPLKANVDTA